ncbi:uncharacterized protein LOC117110718 [Anneissia japonica]|uniref:uncharacterized protein LOC117110718 n=1 Tax=Anneissia japonica TaxID=1529436 RepID=UPI0014259523|nr:uncharacterized protein LOC117110718 [Anneissia japonica]
MNTMRCLIALGLLAVTVVTAQVYAEGDNDEEVNALELLRELVARHGTQCWRNTNDETFCSGRGKCERLPGGRGEYCHCDKGWGGNKCQDRYGVSRDTDVMAMLRDLLEY